MSKGDGTAALSGFAFIFGKKITIDVAGISMDVGSVKGSFGLIFLVLIPIGFEVVSLKMQNRVKLFAVLLSVFGLIMSFALMSVAGSNQLITYKVAAISPAGALYIIIYPVILAVSIIFAIKNRQPKAPKAPKTVVNESGETVSAPRGPIVSDQTKENFAKFTSAAAKFTADAASKAGKAAAELGGKAKDAASTLAASDVKKASNVAEQLKTFKELLDSGVITQEEYDAKKKEILG
jgi:hypothetical protein